MTAIAPDQPPVATDTAMAMADHAGAGDPGEAGVPGDAGGGHVSDAELLLGGPVLAGAARAPSWRSTRTAKEFHTARPTAAAQRESRCATLAASTASRAPASTGQIRNAQTSASGVRRCSRRGSPSSVLIRVKIRNIDAR